MERILALAAAALVLSASALAAPSLPDRGSGGGRSGSAGHSRPEPPSGGFHGLGQGQAGGTGQLPTTLPNGMTLPVNPATGGQQVEAVESARQAATEALSGRQTRGATLTTGTTDVDAEAEPALEATGEGTIQLLGTLRISASGRGTLHIDSMSQVVWEDPERVQVAQESNGLRYTVNSTSNSVQVTGANVQMTLEGESLRVTVYGNGTATLRGSGSYSQPNRSARWPDDGETIVLQSPATIDSVTSALTTTTIPAQLTLPSGAVGLAGPSGLDRPQSGLSRDGNRQGRNR
ncbi:MAG: hypothetical protein HUU25_10850 [Candidatus Sumerlaeia bacterium]|nr:hypothetical protein [Candidatus Sumerlaeia bacterium]